MSKERLEEKINFSDLPFEKRIKLTKESIQKDLKASDYLFPKNVYINTKYILEIIEQAERVQELEEDYEYLSHHYGLETEQNKRYREAKKQIEEKYEYFQDVPSSVSTGLSMAIEILDKALEGD